MLAPSLTRSWPGRRAGFRGPPDTTGAVGTSRYIELVNSGFAIYDKTSDAPLAEGSLLQLTGSSTNGLVFDPQVIWDPTTRRFYYSAAEDETDTLFGFSKTASPSTGTKKDWCRYHISYPKRLFPDFPRLGDSRGFAIIGVNMFARGGPEFFHADLTAISKPRAGHLGRCPRRSSFKVAQTRLPHDVFAPVPANEIDSESTGWVVTAQPFNSSSGDGISLLKVKRGRHGRPVIQAKPRPLAVPTFDLPPNAPEPDRPNQDPGGLLDTLDARFTQAVGAIDPAHGDRFALWTQHTVTGGAGAAVRWYEIDPTTPSLLQHGHASSPSLYEFNGAISPDRHVMTQTAGGGGSMVLNYNTSSSTSYPAIRLVAKQAGEQQSAPVTVKRSTDSLEPIDDSACYDDKYCRWGDYASATPDPLTGSIWQASQYIDNTDCVCYGSHTWNFVARP